jgi:hypothetical protein
MAAQATIAARPTHEMAARAARVLTLLWEAFREQDPRPLAAARELLGDAPGAGTAAGTPACELAASQAQLLGSVADMLRDRVPFTERAVREIGSLFASGVELLECARDALLTENRVLLRHLLAAGAHHAQLANDYAMAHQQRLTEGVCLPHASAVYLRMLDHLKVLGHHARKIAEELTLTRGPAIGAR